MSLPQIVCENCGAKYRLPESFQGAQAKCKACGNVIDVAAQRAAADKPASAKAEPAAARPAKARPARAERATGGRRSRRGAEAAAAAEGDEKPARPGRRGAPDKSRRGRRGSEEGGDQEGDDRRGRAARGEKKDNKAVLIGSAIGVLAIVVVAIIFLMGGNGDQQPGTTDTAQSQGQPKGGDEASGGEGGAAGAQDADAQKSEGGQPVEGAMPPGGQPATQPGEQPAAVPEQPKTPDPVPDEDKPDVPPDSPAWMKSDVTSADRVFDPKKQTEPVAWPEYVTAEDRAKITELLDEVQHGGAKAPHAKVELEEMGHKAIAGIVNRLREVNYFDSWESMYAWELNKLLEAMTIGMNVGFVAIEIGEDIDPRKADWNAKTAKAWQKLLDLYPTPERFEELLKARKTRNK